MLPFRHSVLLPQFCACDRRPGARQIFHGGGKWLQSKHGFDSVFTITSLKRTQSDPNFMLSVPVLEQAVKPPLLFRQPLYCINACMYSLHRFMYNNLQSRTSGEASKYAHCLA
jgi:hypothetical protein